MKELDAAMGQLDAELGNIIESAKGTASPQAALETALVGIRKTVVRAMRALAEGIDDVDGELYMHRSNQDPLGCKHADTS